MNGGYYMIDCKGLNLLAESAQTITGLREESDTAYATGKPLLACNCKWGTTPITPIAVMAIPIGDDLVFTASTLQIYVAKNSAVTVVNMAPAG